jgi:hypothetical protein
MVTEPFESDKSIKVMKELISTTILFLSKSFQKCNSETLLKKNAVHLIRWMGLKNSILFPRFTRLNKTKQTKMFKTWDDKTKLLFYFVEFMMSSPSSFPFLSQEQINTWQENKGKNTNNYFTSLDDVEDNKLVLLTLSTTNPLELVQHSDNVVGSTSTRYSFKDIKNGLSAQFKKNGKINFEQDRKTRFAKTEFAVRSFVYGKNSYLTSNMQHYLEQWKDCETSRNDRINDILVSETDKFTSVSSAFGLNVTTSKYPKILDTISRKSGKFGTILTKGLLLFKEI